jgi:hypothetical protein
MNPRCNLVLMLAFAVCVRLATAAAPVAGPDPSLQPADVVRIQLLAFQNNDRPAPDAGIATAFALASPENRAKTGPLSRFIRMIHETYEDMLNHREARLLPGQVDGDEALQPVELVAADGHLVRYLFVLRRQTAAGCAGCWLTDGVIPAVNSGKSAQKPRQLEL